LKEYGAVDEMHVLEKTHKEFHNSVRNVLLHKSQGEESLASRNWTRSRPFLIASWS